MCSLTAVWVRSWHRTHGAGMKVWAGLQGRVRFSAHSGCQRNSVPCSCQSEVPISTLAVRCGWSHILEASCILWLIHRPPPRQKTPCSKSAVGEVKFGWCFPSLLLLQSPLSDTVGEDSPLLRTHGISLGPPRQSRIIFPSRGPSLNHMYKVPWSCKRIASVQVPGLGHGRLWGLLCWDCTTDPSPGMVVFEARHGVVTEESTWLGMGGAWISFWAYSHDPG